MLAIQITGFENLHCELELKNKNMCTEMIAHCKILMTFHRINMWQIHKKHFRHDLNNLCFLTTFWSRKQSKNFYIYFDLVFKTLMINAFSWSCCIVIDKIKYAMLVFVMCISIIVK